MHPASGTRHEAPTFGECVTKIITRPLRTLHLPHASTKGRDETRSCLDSSRSPSEKSRASGSDFTLLKAEASSEQRSERFPLALSSSPGHLRKESEGTARAQRHGTLGKFLGIEWLASAYFSGRTRDVNTPSQREHALRSSVQSARNGHFHWRRNSRAWGMLDPRRPPPGASVPDLIITRSSTASRQARGIASTVATGISRRCRWQAAPGR